MSLHEPDLGNMSVAIIGFNTTTVTTFYQLQVSIDAYQWVVEHRYSNFAELNSQLVTDKLIAADLLPGKKLIGSREPAFVDRRRQDLDAYIRRVVTLLQVNLPDVLAKFLQLDVYDMGWMLRRHAFFCYVHESGYVGGQKLLTMSPMEVQGLTRLVREGRADFFFHESKLSTPPSQVVDVATQVPNLRVAGSWQELPHSNIRPAAFPFSLELFRALRKLTLHDVPISSLASLAGLRERLVELTVTGGAVRELRDVLLCGAVHRDGPLSADLQWPCLLHLTLRDNAIRAVDGSVAALLPRLVSLDLGTNAIEQVGHLAALPELRHLDLSSNCLGELPDLHTRLGRITRLQLSQNRIGSLTPFVHILSLVQVDLSFNQVRDVEELGNLRGLPVLRDLSLVGNPVTSTIDYRARALERLGRRAPHVTLDNEASSQSELDRVLVLQALRTAREGGPEFLRRGWQGCVVSIV